MSGRLTLCIYIDILMLTLVVSSVLLAGQQRSQLFKTKPKQTLASCHFVPPAALAQPMARLESLPGTTSRFRLAGGDVQQKASPLVHCSINTTAKQFTSFSTTSTVLK